jgi:membrane-bound serine protease (ClpP class)
MDALLNPNLAYLLLVAGFLLAISAVLSPGTGLLEIGALFALLFAGYEVYNIPINVWALVILLLGVIPFLLAVRKSGKLIFLVISILALVIGSAFLFRGETWWQPAVNPVLAVVTSTLTAVFFWVAVRKTLEAESVRPTHDLSILIGAIGEAKTDIDIDGDGSVQVSGELWTARSQKPISAGSQIRVLNREGFILEVEAEEQQQSQARDLMQPTVEPSNDQG